MDPNSHIHKLLRKFLTNNCTRAEMDELLNLLKRAENEPEIRKILSDYWNEISDKSIRGSAFSSYKDPDTWFDTIYSEALDREESLSVRPVRKDNAKLVSPYRRSSQLLKVAAILLITFCVSVFYYNSFLPEESSEVAFEQKIAGPGEKIRFALSDGTQVHLNAGSKLRYPVSFDGSARKIHLEGEAYFIVARDEERPFLIQTEQINTRVLGTSFNLRSYAEEDQVIVAVTNGKVAVTETGHEKDIDHIAEEVVLEAGQWIDYSLKTGEFTSGSGDLGMFTAWNEGKLLYHNKNLQDVAVMLERWYGVDIIFGNEAVKGCVVHGEHQNETLTNVLEAITYAFGIEYRIEERQVVLTGEGCE